MDAGELLRLYAEGKRNFHRANLSETDLSEANLSGADLSEADLSGASLSGTNLSEADLIEADLSEADLSEANLIEAKLWGADLSGVDLSGAKLWGANLNEAYLIEADLKAAELSRADLWGADLSGANLKATDLRKVQLLDAKFEEAILTAACIEDWNINTNTNLDNVICDYVYLKKGEQERRPHTGNFKPGEFTKLFQESLETVDLIFREGVDWKAFAYSFANTQVVNEDTSLNVKSIENKGDGTVVIRVGVPPSADKGKIYDDLCQGYEFAHKALEAQYQARLEDKDKHINHLFHFVNQLQQQLGEVPKLMSETKKEYTFNAPVGSVGNEGNQAGVAGYVKGDNKTIQHHYPAEKKQTLAEAAEEIQKLLKQLEETNPTATEVEQQGYINALVPPNNKTKIVNALQAGWKEAIKELLDNPYLNVAIATLEGWQSAGK